MKIKNRVKELRIVPASELLPNPKNWRTHPKAQQDALRGVLAEVGMADACLARELPDGSLMLIDGHLRAETAADAKVPVLILDVNEAEADKLLATLDPLAAMADSDAAKLDELLRNVDTGSEALQQLMASTADAAGLYANVAEVEPPQLDDGDRDPFRQVTFTLHDDQHVVVTEAIAKAKREACSDSHEKEDGNSNGNALSFICEAFLRG